MTLDFEKDDRPPYIQAAELLRQDIRSGRLEPGDRLPSARTLQDRYGVASSTIQNALRLLKNEGLIYSVQGRGSFVRNSPAPAETPASEFIREFFEPAPEKPASTEGAQSHDLTPSPLHSDEFNTLAQAIQELTGIVAAMTDQVSKLQQQIADQGKTSE
ncbi:winged helix-turn-helix domain-containing protein [Streptomyces sp. NPDC001584]|uniref:GntR family transcriptional regulator n=1 Tax=Streptomyces sp. NPDC001584 TaxID=3154521 RepID=UPI003319E37C